MSPAKFPEMAAAVEKLHAVYARSTGFELRLDYARIRAWHDFIQAGLGEADLALVVGYLRRKIAAGDRNPGALKFSNLIVQLDRFEEDLALARAENRIRTRGAEAAPRPLPAGWQDYLRQHYPGSAIPADGTKLPEYMQKEIREALR